MSVYLIGYDLNNPGQNYTDLLEAIKKYGTWWHNLDSTCIIVTDSTASQIRDKLAKLIDKNDELLVVKLGSGAAWQGFSDKGSEWLKNNLP